MDYDHLVTRLSTWLASIAMLVMAAACASGFHTAAELEQQPAAALAFPGAHETVAPTTHDEGEVGAYVRRYYAVTASSGAVIAWY